MKRYPLAGIDNSLAKYAVFETGVGRLLHVECYNANAGDMYLQLFDSATLPDNGAVPLQQLRIPKTDTGALDFGIQGLEFANGIVAALSSTASVLTLASANDGLFSGATDYDH